MLIALAGGWLVTGRGGPENGRFGRTLFGFTALFLLVERGPADVLAVEYDRISVVHLALVGAVWVVFEIGPRLTGSSGITRRLAVVGGMTLPALLIVTLVFPGFWAGPFVEVPAELQAYWLDRVAELAPLWSAAAHRWTDLMFMIGSTLMGLGFAAMAVTTAIRRRRLVGPWLFVALWLLAMGALAVRNVRFVVYPEAMAAVPTAWWAREYLGKVRARGSIGSLRRVAVMAFVIVGFAVPVGVARALEGPAPDPAPDENDCNLRKIAADLESTIRATGPPYPVVLAAIDAGPELLWRFPVRIVTDPYHRNVEGILDARAIFGSTDWATAHALLQKHDVAYALVCDGDPEGFSFGPGTLYQALLTNQPPPGLLLVRSSGSLSIFAADRD
jgi:hypothetical protein